MKVLVQCTYEIEVEYDDKIDDEHIHFLVEENGCPWTGSVGATFDKIREGANENWTCYCGQLKATNKILKIER